MKTRVWRQIHHLSSVAVFGLLFFYWFTGYVMSHRSWFPKGQETRSDRTVALTVPLDTVDQQAFFQQLKDTYDLHGRTGQLNKAGTQRWRTWFGLPGVSHELTIDAAVDSLTIRTRRNESFVHVNDRLHHIRGYEGGPLYIVWATLIDLLVVALLVFAVTGFILWSRMKKAYRYGGWLLLLTSAFTAGITLWVWLV